MDKIILAIAVGMVLFMAYKRLRGLGERTRRNFSSGKNELEDG